MRRATWVRLGLFLLALAVTAVLWSRTVRSDEVTATSWSELVAAVDEGRVAEVLLESDRVEAVLKTPDQKARRQVLVASRLPNLDERALLERLLARGVKVSGRIERQSAFWAAALSSIFPLVMLVLLFRTAGGLFGGKGGARPMSFGKSQAKIYDRSSENKASFTDVAGVDEAKAELLEVVNFLKEPARYRALGARIPKGVLLVGAPGTGKTLLARAVAGEAGVPFFSMSGSEFVEMFVGVGASRVRDLFTQARERAPCIVFIDELDAVGKARAGGNGLFAANEEREQTLNQLLVEMDGFDPGVGIVIMAATNRPEVLDKALLRAGRFDRQVLVDRPDVRGREAILGVHLKRLTKVKDVDLTVLARRTPGMVGADLANVVNEAALACVRRRGEAVEPGDFDEALDRIQLGLRKAGLVMRDEERRRVAWHEAGHALVAMSVTHSDPVHRVTIIPRSVGALGATLQLPLEDRYLMTQPELDDALAVLMGGRAAEALAFEHVSTGAQNDLERASELARQMVCRFGMSGLGPQTFGRAQGGLLPGAATFEERTFSDDTARRIDDEVTRVLETAFERARAVLTQRRAQLDAIATRLLEVETLEKDALDALARPGAVTST
ncbi:MAG: ATP-dependent zinc metalloprotease FtsH [Myxococcaceae bacterium]|jgi:cell division protease FtsH|nr:ATP-dependent zinc metalloprotease FtsH [Myxococcaceae bacterium]MCA3015710.1 ATP-dependent zinc metalloprotease FtsH [Myxococcaceae bacterium]